MRGLLPDDVRVLLQEDLTTSLQTSVVLGAQRPVTGGCIHNALAVESSVGPFFVKWSRGRAGAAFGSEAHALDVLRRAALPDGLIAVPEVLASRDAAGVEAGWLVLEYLPPSAPPSDYASRLGEGLARLHARGSELCGELREREATVDVAGPSLTRTGTSAAPPSGGVPHPPSFGWFEENRIGSLDQSNPWMESWASFWRDARLLPQLESAFREGGLESRDREWSDRLLDAVEPALAAVSGAEPALLHGDLWSGNVHAGPDGRPVLVDPATYLGHGEVDLAMARLFGGFDEETFRCYRDFLPGLEGFEAVRLALYQLYYLLVHVRLFGAGYLADTRRAADSVIRSVL